MWRRTFTVPVYLKRFLYSTKFINILNSIQVQRKNNSATVSLNIIAPACGNSRWPSIAFQCINCHVFENLTIRELINPSYATVSVILQGNLKRKRCQDVTGLHTEHACHVGPLHTISFPSDKLTIIVSSFKNYTDQHLKPIFLEVFLRFLQQHCWIIFSFRKTFRKNLRNKASRRIWRFTFFDLIEL